MKLKNTVKSNQNWILAIGAVLALWLGLRLHYHPFWHFSDVPRYMDMALLFARGDFITLGNIGSFRLGVFVPVSIFIKIFGNNTFALMLWPLCGSFLALFSTMALSYLFLGRWFAVIAGLLYATYIPEVFYSTMLLPDVMLSGWLAFMIFWTVMAAKAEGRKKLIYLTFVFGCLAMIYLTRIDGLILIPLLPFIYLIAADKMNIKNLKGLFTKKNLKFIAIPILPIFLIFAVEGFFNSVTGKGFFHRYHQFVRLYTKGNGVPLELRRGLINKPHIMPQTLLNPNTFIKPLQGKATIRGEMFHGLLYQMSFLFLLVLLLEASWNKFKKRKSLFINSAFKIICVWLLWQVFYRQWGTQSFTVYIPVHRLPRHFITYAPSAILLICFFLHHYKNLLTLNSIKNSLATPRKFYKKLTIPALTAIAFALHISVIPHTIKGQKLDLVEIPGRAGSTEKIVKALKNYKGNIFGEWALYQPLNFYINGVEKMKYAYIQSLQLTPSCEKLEGSMVYFKASHYWYNNMIWKRRILSKLPCLANPPDHWVKIDLDGPEALYYVPNSYDKDAKETASKRLSGKSVKRKG